MLVLALPAALLLHGIHWRATSAGFRRYSEEGRFAFRHGPGDLLRKPVAETHFLHGVSLLKQQLGGGPGAGWFQDDFFLCAHRLGGRRVWVFRPGPPGTETGRFREVTGRMPAVRRRVCGGARAAPLAARLTWTAGRLSWRLGPYRRGSYAVLLEDGVERFEVERIGSMRRFERRTGLRFRVRYQAPEGWVTYSPELRLDVERRPALCWRR